MSQNDTVDLVRQQWDREFPDLDTRALGITHRITALATRINRDAEAVFGEFEVTGATFDVLAALYAAGPPYQLNPTQLSKGRLVSSGGMTARIDLAEAAGLVARSRAQRDRRGVTVTLSGPGVRVVREGVVALLAREGHLKAALDADDRKAITPLLTQLLQPNAVHVSTANATLDSNESLISSWVQAFPGLDSWLVHFLGAIPLLSNRVESESRKVVAQWGLTPNGFGLLCALRRAGAPFRLTPSELYDVVVLSPAGVAGQLEKMERVGLIVRSGDPEDKRLNRASLTRRGQKVVNNTIGDFVMRHDWLLKPLSEKDREALTGFLRRILSSVEHRRDEAAGQP
jgi:DNA-binding MarR family transcriptional regulator